MLVLGIDTSCDDTSAAVVEDGGIIRSNIVSSQSDIHSKYGGIVPELASRRHIEMIVPVADEAISRAGIRQTDISAVAVCNGPGLIGSLLVGCSFAKAFCYSTKTPLVPVNHLEGHIMSAFLESPAPSFPFLSLVVSGGHTSLYIVEGFGAYSEIGRTRDDAAGEAYDKVSKLLGLGYPGGPVIDRIAAEGDRSAIDLPRAFLPGSFDFSFSGIKTAVLNIVRGRDYSGSTGAERETMVRNIAASFQKAMVDVLVRKTERAAREKRMGRVTLSGGVAANAGLRSCMKAMAEKNGIELYMPSPAFCTDNAAMIAVAGFHRAEREEFAGLDLNPKAYLSL